MELLSRHRVFSTDDVDDASAFADRMWERNHTTILDGRYGLRWNHVAGDRIGCSYIEHDCTVDLKTEGPTSDHFWVFLHDEGWIKHRAHRRECESTHECVVAHPPGTDLGLVLAPCRFMLVSFDGPFVRHALEQRFRNAPAFKEWLNALPQSDNVRALQSMARWLATEIDMGSPLSIPGKPRLHAERLLLSLFIESLADAAPAGTETVEELSRAQVRTAEEWIDAHLTEAIGVEEVATAVGVGIRSLQASFKRVRRQSPRALIMRRRLDRTREMLLTAGTDATVTDVAMSVGFLELGRFAQRYRERFGESPSTTLKRRAAADPINVRLLTAR